MNLPEAAKLAIDVQNACNLSGVLRSWADVCRVIIDEVGGNGSDAFRQHPLNVLFLSKVASLLRMNADCIGGVSRANGEEAFAPAYAWANSHLEKESK